MDNKEIRELQKLAGIDPDQAKTKLDEGILGGMQDVPVFGSNVQETLDGPSIGADSFKFEEECIAEEGEDDFYDGHYDPEDDYAEDGNQIINDGMAGAVAGGMAGGALGGPGGAVKGAQAGSAIQDTLTDESHEHDERVTRHGHQIDIENNAVDGGGLGEMGYDDGIEGPVDSERSSKIAAILDRTNYGIDEYELDSMEGVELNNLYNDIFGVEEDAEYSGNGAQTDIDMGGPMEHPRKGSMFNGGAIPGTGPEGYNDAKQFGANSGNNPMGKSGGMPVDEIPHEPHQANEDLNRMLSLAGLPLVEAPKVKPKRRSLSESAQPKSPTRTIYENLLKEYETFEAEYGDEPVDNINRPMQHNDQEMQVDNVPLIDSEDENPLASEFFGYGDEQHSDEFRDVPRPPDMERGTSSGVANKDVMTFNDLFPDLQANLDKLSTIPDDEAPVEETEGDYRKHVKHIPRDQRDEHMRKAPEKADRAARIASKNKIDKKGR